MKEILKEKNGDISIESERVDQAPPGAKSAVIERRIQREEIGVMGRPRVERGLNGQCARE